MACPATVLGLRGIESSHTASYRPRLVHPSIYITDKEVPNGFAVADVLFSNAFNLSRANPGLEISVKDEYNRRQGGEIFSPRGTCCVTDRRSILQVSSER